MLAFLIIITIGMVLSPAFMAVVGVVCYGLMYAGVFVLSRIWKIAAAILGFFNHHVIITMILVALFIYVVIITIKESL